MRVLVVGAGAVGAFFAARLRLADHDVVVWARPDAAARINADGLTLIGDGQEWPLSVRAAASAADTALRRSFELAIVAVKSFSTASAARDIAALPACADAAILCVQNGVGNEEILAQTFGPKRIVAGALTTAVALDGSAVTAGRRGGLSIAPMGSAPHNWLLPAFERTGLRVRPAADWRALKWSKLAINLVANAVCAILDWTPAQVYGDRDAFAVERACLREAFDVMRAGGVSPIDLIDFPVRSFATAVRVLPAALLRVALASRVGGARGGKLPSLLLDVRAGKRETEVGALNGAVARSAAAVDVPAPANAGVTRVLEGIVSGAVDPAIYRGAPARLRADVMPVMRNP